MLIATLIAAGRLDDRLLAAALARVPGARVAGWVEEGEAIDLQVPDNAAREALQGWEGCDVVVQPAATRAKRLLVADMDSTMIGQECIDELADYANLKPQIAAITERAMQGELDFEAALRERVALLAGLEESAIAQCLADRITATPGAKTLVATLAALGTRTVLVTGGFHHFADPVAEMLGFHRVVGNRLAVEDGKLTGGLVGPITDSAVKAAVLREELGNLGEGALSLATGDGANDIPMIAAATYGFAYRAKPKARAAANGRVDGEDLTAVLTLLGVPEDQWIVA